MKLINVYNALICHAGQNPKSCRRRKWGRAFKEKIINGVKQQPAAACKKCQQKQNKVINFLFGFYHAVAVVAVFQRNHLVLFRGYPVYILTLSYTKLM